MRNSVLVGLIGDFDASVPAHRAIPLALDGAAQALAVRVIMDWIATDEVDNVSRISRYHGLWCVPASPYRSMDGTLLSIRHARENAVPFLGTCGGFQHAVLEYARNVMRWSDAEHAESAAGAGRSVISLLPCSLVETTERVHLLPATRIRAAYGVDAIDAQYRCRYGLNNGFRSALTSGPLRVAAENQNGDVRAVELSGEAFFVATLFQPERRALNGEPVPLVAEFLKASISLA
jgi:CTP synthase (UTP-ammonia lyase)